MSTVFAIDMSSRICSSSLRARRSSSRWNRIAVCRMRSTRSNTSAPSWSRTVSPRMRPSSRMSFLSRASSSSACTSSARVDLSSASEGMVWGDMFSSPEDARRIKSASFLPQRKMKMRAALFPPSNPPPRPLPIGIAEAALEDFAGIFPRQVGMDFDGIWTLVVGQRGFQPGADVGDFQHYAWLRFHHRHQRFAEFRVGYAEHRAIMHAGHDLQHRLDLGG